MSKRDCYEILGVSKSADSAEIKKAYKKIAMKYHPDRNPAPDAEDKFKEASEAYEILSDADKKAQYDRFGHDAFNSGGGGGYRSSSDFASNFSDIFSDFFGGFGSSQSRGPKPGNDLQYELEISFEQAVFGDKVEITIPVRAQCKRCDGKGAEPGSDPVTCNQCGGSGQISIQQGFLSIQQTCPYCKGRGSLIKNPCNSCHGEGRIKEQKILSIKIPAGIDNGMRIRLSNEGEAGETGAPNGDLYVRVHVKEHKFFERDGNNLYCKMPISFATAALGGTIEVPSLKNFIKLKIPAGTQSGQKFKLKNKGIKSYNSATEGDIICQIVIETPVHLSDEQKKLIAKFDSSISGNSEKHSPNHFSFVDKIKNLFS